MMPPTISIALNAISARMIAPQVSMNPIFSPLVVVLSHYIAINEVSQ